jgi:Peptidase family M23
MRSLSPAILVLTAVAFIFQAAARAQSCSDAPAPSYFKPLTDGDGLRYPIEIGPLSWKVMGEAIQPVKGSDGLTHLAYTLLFTNSWGRPATLKSIEVVDPTKGDAVTGKNLVLTGKNEDITGEFRILSRTTTQDKANFATEVPPGQSAVMYFDVTYAEGEQVPPAIAHRIVENTQSPDGKLVDFTVTSEPLPLNCKATMVLIPPFKGAGWVNGNGCCKEIGPHRFVMNSINGGMRPTEEFAIDWVRLDGKGRMFHGDPKDVKNWYDYGADVLAVGAGTVVEVVRDIPDGEPGTLPSGLTMGQVGGNRVIIDMGHNHYAEYEHLVKDSPTVHVGDYVRQGEKIGLLGNTGNSDAPHLHFQIMDRPSSLDGSALPFVFDRMRLEGRIPLSLLALDDAMTKNSEDSPIPVDKKDAKTLTREMPLSLDVLDFE